MTVVQLEREEAVTIRSVPHAVKYIHTHPDIAKTATTYD